MTMTMTMNIVIVLLFYCYYYRLEIMKRVVVTGVGMISGLGESAESTFNRIVKNENSIRPIS